MTEPGRQSPQEHHVTLTFDRPVTEEEIRQMQQQHNAVRAAASDGGHHDHDHPKLVS